MTHRSLSFIDRLVVSADNALRTLTGSSAQLTAPSPADAVADRHSEGGGHHQSPLNDTERRHAAGLMRVNHSGEVCAQALYQSQALTAKLPKVRRDMEQAAREEEDHLAWCEQRLRELNSHPSLFNPLWYGCSFALGASAGILSDRLSLGFVAATEELVCQHLEHHLAELPKSDRRSHAVVTQMLTDEARHASNALAAGGWRFPPPVKKLMSVTARVMTASSYRL